MLDPISMIIDFLKSYLQRIKGVFSFVLDNYFPKEDDKKDDLVGFAFL